MTTRIKLVQGDDRPDIILAMVDKTTWNPIDVSDSTTTVSMDFRFGRSENVLTTIVATKLTGQLLSDGVVDESVTTPGAGGRVMFSWPPGALDVDPGLYEGEVYIDYDGSVQTVYDRLHFYVREDM